MFYFTGSTLYLKAGQFPVLSYCNTCLRSIIDTVCYMCPFDIHLSLQQLRPASSIATVFCACCRSPISCARISHSRLSLPVTSPAFACLLWSHLHLHLCSRISCSCISAVAFPAVATLQSHFLQLRLQSHFLQLHLCSHISCSLLLQAWAGCELRFGWLDSMSVYFIHSL